MKKLFVVIAVLALVTLACGLQRVTPTPVPPITQPTERPVLPLTTARPVEPTAVPPLMPTLPQPQPAGDGEVYEDDFSTINERWHLSSDAEYTREIRDGEMILGIVPAMKDSWTSLDMLTPQDLVVEVEARQLAGPAKSDFGIVCGMQDVSNFFALTAGYNGLVEIFKYVDGTHTEVMSLDYHPAISATGTNYLKATCQGSTLSLSVNGQEVATATDTSLKPGHAGLIIGTFEEGGVSFAFDNLRVQPYSAETAGTDALEALHSGTLLYEDNFDAAQSDWDDYSGESSSATPADGVYKIRVNNADWEAFANPYNYFMDGIVVDVDATVKEGFAENGFGIVCGYQDIDDFFALLVGTQGYAEIVRYTADGRQMLVDASGVPVSPETNHVTVTCGQNKLVLYVNGVEALSTTHTDLKSGDVGLIAGTFKTTPVEIHFDNFVVRQLP